MTLECTVTHRQSCRFCAEDFKIRVETIIDDETKLPEDIIDAIDAELDRLGWLAGACPECAVKHRETLLEEHHADDDQPQWEGGEYV